MIEGLTLEYAYARVCARLAQRPDERLWSQVRSARSVPALLETLRGSVAASTVTGIAPGGDADSLEIAFRQQLRTRVDEVAAWAPTTWQGALGFTRFLGDLPAVVQLLSEEPPPRWIGADPELAPYAQAALADRRAALASGPLAPMAAALDEATHAQALGREEPLSRALKRLRSGPALHRALAVWESEWRARWPRASSQLLADISEVGRTIRAHLLRFGAIAVDDAGASRQSLAARLATLVRRFPAQPASLFAYLGVVALDLERLRGEFVVRARAVEVAA
jgi:hypothetical protein